MSLRSSPAQITSVKLAKDHVLCRTGCLGTETKTKEDEDLRGRDRWDGKTLWKLLVSNYLNISSEAFECPHQGH